MKIDETPEHNPIRDDDDVYWDQEPYMHISLGDIE